MFAAPHDTSCGETSTEGAANVNLAFDRQPTLVAAESVFDDRQAQAGAARIA